MTFTLKCNNPEILELYLSKLSPEKETCPNGQMKYTFTDGLVANVYLTKGTVNFQGKNTEGNIAALIRNEIGRINGTTQ
jgi:hypothetical protein